MANGTLTLEEFLHKETIGSLTGLTKRFADLDLFDEPRKLPPELQPHVYLGMLACYLLRERKVHKGRNGVVWDIDDPKHPARRLLDAGKDIFDEHAAQVYELHDEIGNSATNHKHRFHVLMYDYGAIRDDEDEILEALGSARLRLPHKYALAAAAKKYPSLPPEEGAVLLKNERRTTTYRNLTQLLGIYIAEGRNDDALFIADELDRFPDREQQEMYGHSRTVAAYLRNGGAQTLDRRVGGLGFLWNKYWYRTAFGNHKHPGKLYNLFNESRNEIIATATGVSIGAVSTALLLPAAQRAGVFLLDKWELLIYYLERS